MTDMLVDETPWLPDRPSFDKALGRHMREHSATTAVIVLELMDLPALASTYGSQTTPAIVTETGHRFFAQLRSPGANDNGPVAQLGEARFATAVTGLSHRDQAFRMARKLCRDMSRPMTVDNNRLAPTFCVGIAYFDGGSETATELTDQAETALAEARRHGPGAFCLFNHDMEERMRRRMLLRESLQHAIDIHQLRLHYQPIVELATGRVLCAEALARWMHPEMGVQSPADFIAAAEESGLIVELGAQMLTRALRDRSGWRAAGLNPPPIAVNVSARQLQRPGFVEMVTRALAETDAQPEDLELELTEGTLIETTGGMLEQLNLLSRMGIVLSVDDFGTGFSSLRYLRDMPVRKLKIDQYFIRDIARDPRDLSIVRAIVAMAGALDLQVVAEGIETQQQREKLIEAGCRIGQGYLFAAPMAEEKFAERLRSWRGAPLEPMSSPAPG